MASKWKYERLDQNDEKEDEVLVVQQSNQHIGQVDSFSQFSSPTPHRNPFDPINLDLNQDVDHKYELKQRSNQTRNQPSTKDDSVELVEYTIKSSDSLLSIALSCNCTVEELKRINKLINDQEFYALRFIKIPVRKYGLLSEVLIHQLNQTNRPISLQEIKASLSNHQLDNLTSLTNHESTNHQSTNHQSTNSFNNLLEQHPQPLINFNEDEESSQPAERSEPEPASSKSSSTNSLIVNVGLKKTFDFDKTDGDLNKFLVYLDKDLEKMRKLTNNSKPSIVEPLDSNDIYLLNGHRPDNRHLDCDGANCGLTWKSVFFIAIFVCILIPMIYLVIYAEENSMNHHLKHHLNHH